VAILFATGTAYVGIAALNAQTRLEVVRDGRRRLAELRASSLPERAKHAARALQEAVTLVEDLRSELDARTALLEDIRRQVAEATERASDMEKLSHVDEETTRLLNKYFDEALKSRLAALERGARGREWFIGTVVALVIGVGVILLSNYVLGF
jgi:predicted nuclease with TOPRIM domain